MPALSFGPIHMVVVSISAGRGRTARQTDWPMKRGLGASGKIAARTAE
jgi:hypothetical protein